MVSVLRKKSLACAALLAGVGLGVTAHAQDNLHPLQGTGPGGMFSSTSPYLFGDWNGERTRLADEGISFNLGYGGGELAHNLTGGREHRTEWAGQLYLGANLDLDKLWGWSGASFHFIMTGRDGNNLSSTARLGTLQQVQEVYGRGQTWLLTQFSYEQKFLDGKIDWNIGRLPIGSNFGFGTCDYENLGFFCGATVGNIGGNYWYNWPLSSWATNIKLNTSDQTYIQLGAYQVNNNYTNQRYQRSHGFYPDFPGGTIGWTLPLEFGWTPTINGLPGHYRFGFFYSTVHPTDIFYDDHNEPFLLSGEPAKKRNGNYGGYLNFTQQVTGTAGGKGLDLIFAFTQSNPNTSNSIQQQQIGLGMEYHGPFDRPNDFIGFAVGGTKVSGRQREYDELYNDLNPATPVPVQSGYEYISELYYSWSPIPSIQLRPDIQRIIHPGASTQNNNIWVIGMKTEFSF